MIETFVAHMLIDLKTVISTEKLLFFPPDNENMFLNEKNYVFPRAKHTKTKKETLWVVFEALHVTVNSSKFKS